MANVRLPMMECEGEHPRFTRALRIHDHFLICVSQVKPCPVDDCEGAPAIDARMVAVAVPLPPVLPCERAAVHLFHDIKSSGQICGYKHDDILLDRAPRDAAVYKYVHDLTTVASIDGHNFPINGSSMLAVPEFPGSISTVGSRMCATDALRMAGGGSAIDPGMLAEAVDLKLDSGASYHVVCEETLLEGYESLVRSRYIHVADGYPLEVVGIGCIITKEFFVPNVSRVKGLKENLISVSQLARDHGLFLGFHGEICEILRRDGEKVGGGFVQANGIYRLSFLEVPEAEAAYEGA